MAWKQYESNTAQKSRDTAQKSRDTAQKSRDTAQKSRDTAQKSRDTQCIYDNVVLYCSDTAVVWHDLGGSFFWGLWKIYCAPESQQSFKDLSFSSKKLITTLMTTGSFVRHVQTMGQCGRKTHRTFQSVNVNIVPVTANYCVASSVTWRLRHVYNKPQRYNL